MDSAAQTPEPQRRVRMTSAQRREQLISVARALFAERGFDGTSVEEIASHAGVSKPVVYQHFGGKEGIYAVVVDREVSVLSSAIDEALITGPGGYRGLIERGTLALLSYIESSPDGFRIISRDSHQASDGSGSESRGFASILDDATAKSEALFELSLDHRGFSTELARPFARGIVGMVAGAGQAWLEEPTLPKEVLAANLVNLMWNGVESLERHPRLTVAEQSVDSDQHDPKQA